MSWNVAQLSPAYRRWLNILVIIISVLICGLLSMARLPGMNWLGIAPNWFLIWIVSWSIKRQLLQGLLASLTLGLIQDGLTSGIPSHIPSLFVVVIITSLLQKQRYIKEDFISIALIVFGMSLIAETVTAVQYLRQELRPFEEIWREYQRISLTSALLSSLWAPVIYYPLNRWWEEIDK